MSREYMKVTDIIRYRRMELRFTAEDMARMIGFRNVGFLYIIESGYRRIDPDAAPRWADALQLNVREFSLCVLYEAHPNLYAALCGAGEPATPSTRPMTLTE